MFVRTQTLATQTWAKKNSCPRDNYFYKMYDCGFVYNSTLFILGTKKCIINHAKRYAAPQIQNMMK